jgi:uncharacterized protein (UPF0303 family)
MPQFIDTLIAQDQALIWPQFGQPEALALGLALVTMGQASNMPIVINIRTPAQTLFHAALPGATPLNDLWARRKSNTVLQYHMSSMLLGEKMRASGKTFANDGLDEADYAAHGGSVPIRLTSGLVVAAVTVSGLPQRDDHALVIRAVEHALAQGQKRGPKQTPPP